MAAISFEITGDKELDAKFAALTAAVQKKILRQALRPAVKLVQQAAKQIVPVVSGTARASLKVRAAKRSRRNPNRVTITTGGDAVSFKGEAFYLSFNEFGFRRGSRKLGNARKKVPAKRWLRKAMKSVESQAKSLALQGIAEGIEREAKQGAVNA